ncbi:hypothetical protein MRX96_047901 [Rhipicephalus microplus]
MTKLQRLVEVELSLVYGPDSMVRQLIGSATPKECMACAACTSKWQAKATSDALLRCRNIIAVLNDLETFTFTSEMFSYKQPDPTAPLDFVSCAAVCGNVTFRKPTGRWSCVRLCDLVLDCHEPVVLPSQLVMVVVDSDEDSVTEWVRVASLGHDWTKVHLLCLLLFSEEPSSFCYPTAGIAYRESLRLYFSTALKYLNELNICSLRFGADLDFAELLQDGSLDKLHAFSASLCAFGCPSALRRLAQACSDLTDLDIRCERKSGLVQCTGCEVELMLEPKDATDIREGVT